MKIFRLFTIILMAVVYTGFSSCEKDDSSEKNADTSTEQYTSLLYGSWYRESSSELSKSFMSYKFSSNKNVVRYTKSADREKISVGGNASYSDWQVNNENSTFGIWYIEDRGGHHYLKIQWNGNDFYSAYLITYLDSNLLNFEDGFSSDLNRGDKSPNF